MRMIDLHFLRRIKIPRKPSWFDVACTSPKRPLHCYGMKNIPRIRSRIDRINTTSNIKELSSIDLIPCS
jgi:hypothetical protein